MAIKKYGVAVFAVTLLASTSVLAEEVKKEAVILSVNGDNISAQTKQGPITVVMTPETKISETSGLVRSKTRDVKSLIPGLIFTVKGDQQGASVTATDISFKDDDWRAAVASKAGTQAEFAELRQAIIDGQEYVIRDEATVYFASGSATVAQKYKDELSALAKKAPSYGNYRVSILGFADSTGDAAANERLSKRRADAVNSYLRQSGSIQPGRVLSPSAMGEGTTAPGEAAPSSNDQARRVVVRIVTPKGQLSQQGS